MLFTADTCYGALVSRDPRFDGTFFVGVSTTGVYCRPICPARTPRPDRCAFFARAAEAERAGFRACFRCRPELAPGLASVDATARLAQRAARRIDEGALSPGSLETLASDLGVTSRHLRRAFHEDLGVSPLEYAQTRRLALAKQLMTDARLKLADVAFSAGYGSVRRFNAEFRQRFGCAPRDSKLGARAHGAGDCITLRLDHRLPYDWDATLAFLEARAVPGVEHVARAADGGGGRYTRALALGDATGLVTVAQARRPGSLTVSVSLSLARVLPAVVARTRALFDLDAQPDAIAQHLSRDPLSRALASAHPGLRVPGSLDPFEAAVRAVLAQQVSVRAARTLSARLVARHGPALDVPEDAPVSRIFPDAHALSAVRATELAKLGVPLARAEALRTLARAVVSGRIDLGGGAGAEDVVRALLALPGLGPFTASVIAMRALHWPDAFPSTDLLVMRALGARTAREAEARTSELRPFRAYWVMHVWQRAADEAARQRSKGALS